MSVLFLSQGLHTSEKKLRTQSSASVKQPQPIAAGGCDTFTNYWLSQVGLDLRLNLVQHA